MTLRNDLATLSDLAAIELLCSTADDDQIYTEVVRRFLPEVQSECRKKCKRWNLDSQIGDHIAHECFERLRSSKTFRYDKARIVEPTKAILVYLYRIAHFLFIDRHKKEGNNTVKHRHYFDDLQESLLAVIDPKDLDRKAKLSQQILGVLTEREKKIFLTDLAHKRARRYLPDHVVEELCQEFGVKSDTLRKIRERAIKKIEKAIHGINQQER